MTSLKRYFIIIIVFFMMIAPASSQSKFGIEVKAGAYKTENAGQIMGWGYDYHGYEVTKEEDPITYSYSIGLVYKLNEKNVLKLHFGKHQNGRILDLYEYFEAGYEFSVNDVEILYQYFQVTPSYSYRILIKKWIIPLELGININKTMQQEDNDYFRINDINFDYEIGVGIQYLLLTHLLIGIHGIYNHSLNEYLNEKYVIGTYKPRQFGLELSLLYGLKKKE